MPPRVLASLEGLDRPAWLALRRQGLGSSDIGAICGLDRWRSPLAVYLDKIGDADEEPENAQMRMGRILEPTVIELWEHETGLPTEKPTVMYQHAEHDFMLASPDRLTGDDGIVEAKTYTGRGDVYDNGPPQGTILQVTHQLLVADRTIGYVAVLAHGLEFQYWRIDLDPNVVAPLLDIEAEFWQRIERHEPPPADGHPATTAALQRLYRQVEPGSEVDLTEDIVIALAKFRAAKVTTKSAKAAEDLLGNTIKAALGAAEVGLIDGRPAVTWKPISAFDEEAFRRDHPDKALEFSRIAVGDLEDAYPALVKEYRKERAGDRRLNLPKESK